MSILDTLQKYHIDSSEVKIDDEKLNDMPVPCIAQMEVNRQPLFFVMQDVSDSRVFYYDEKNKQIEKTKKDF